MGMRATLHMGRLGKAEHNDRNFNTSIAPHIDQSRSGQNRYWEWSHTRRSFVDSERLFYEQAYGRYIERQNRRADEQRHPERRTSAEKLRTAKRTCPDSGIFQVGKKDGETITTDELQSLWSDFYSWHRKNFGSHICLISAALHADEQTPHIQYRMAYVWRDADGVICPRQDKALEALGFELPHPDKPRGRKNNRKMAYTAACREKLLELCKERGWEIITEPEHRAPSEHNLTKTQFIMYDNEKKIAEQEKTLETLTEQAAETTRKAYQQATEIIAGAPEIAEHAKDIPKAVSGYKRELEGLTGFPASLTPKETNRKLIDLCKRVIAAYERSKTQLERVDYAEGGDRRQAADLAAYERENAERREKQAVVNASKDAQGRIFDILEDARKKAPSDLAAKADAYDRIMHDYSRQLGSYRVQTRDYYRDVYDIGNEWENR